jgi:hypothetical protein
MSTCNIDHTHEEVKKKFESQNDFLPMAIKDALEVFFSKDHTQETLNEVFHLLKKYDLSSEEEQQQRNEKLLAVINR